MVKKKIAKKIVKGSKLIIIITGIWLTNSVTKTVVKYCTGPYNAY